MSVPEISHNIEWGITMSNKIESKIPAWLMELSEQEQQAVAGGFGMFAIFFFQQTDIRSFAENQINFF